MENMQLSKNIIIIESPGKIKKFKECLGKEYEIISSLGHCVDLPIKKIGVDINNEFKPTWEIKTDRKEIVKEIQKIVEDYSIDTVIIEEVFHGVNVKTTAILNRLNGAVTSNLSKDINIILVNASSARKSILGKGKKHSKEDVFNWATTKYKLKEVTFKKHNDITDSILLAYLGTTLVNK